MKAISIQGDRPAAKDRLMSDSPPGQETAASLDGVALAAPEPGGLSRDGTAAATAAAPAPALSTLDAVSLIVGGGIGAGIFKTPALIAANVGHTGWFLLAWVLGGLASLVGALCYAELTTAYPHAGGDYHYLKRAFGGEIAFLFGWARMTVMQTGSIAMLAFVFGDYASHLVPLGPAGASLYAVSAIGALTLVNLLSVHQGRWTQKVLTGAKVLGLSLVVMAGLLFAPPSVEAAPAQPAAPAAFGLAMVFVLLTYGGWSEAAYISAELQDSRRAMVRSLLWGIGVIAAVFLLANVAYLQGLGLAAMSRSDVVAAEVMRRAAGEGGATLASLLIAISASSGLQRWNFRGKWPCCQTGGCSSLRSRGACACGRTARCPSRFRECRRWCIAARP